MGLGLPAAQNSHSEEGVHGLIQLSGVLTLKPKGNYFTFWFTLSLLIQAHTWAELGLWVEQEWLSLLPSPAVGL